MKRTPTRTFLLRQETKNGKLIETIAERGKEIDVTDAEAKQFAGSFEPVEKTKGPLTTEKK